jgi:hypothetical protein
MTVIAAVVHCPAGSEQPGVPGVQGGFLVVLDSRNGCVVKSLTIQYRSR